MHTQVWSGVASTPSFWEENPQETSTDIGENVWKSKLEIQELRGVIDNHCTVVILYYIILSKSELFWIAFINALMWDVSLLFVLTLFHGFAIQLPYYSLHCVIDSWGRVLIWNQTLWANACIYMAPPPHSTAPSLLIIATPRPNTPLTGRTDALPAWDRTYLQVRATNFFKKQQLLIFSHF